MLLKAPALKSTEDVDGPVVKVTYRYADAGNWKFWGTFHVLGDLRMKDLQPYLFDQEFFIPQRIGLPSLVPVEKNEDDHLLHTVEALTEVGSAPYECTAQELIQRFRHVHEEGWFTGIC